MTPRIRPTLIALSLSLCLLLPRTAHAFYNPSSGRWLSRDPLGERGGPNLYVFICNDPLERIDHLGLATSATPGSPHVSNNEHENYLIFHISCPADFKVSNVTADYNDPKMWDEMYQYFVTEGEGQTDPHVNKPTFIRHIQNSMGNSFGGIQDPGRPNCRGNPVEVHAWMRTRLVAPAWYLALWRDTFGTPDPSAMIGLYQENTQIHYTCDNCCRRSLSN